ncbi:type II toxin-antitoxin system HicB family antitoxin [Sphingomonas sp. CFBP 13720]|uniref:type II toxin-antitoxin system HicB family antitoxin n=1 Tax=Sphingomonas sp. CFBP 13720 TaxID=2775302 RepID=UPI00178262E6|nr:type II toxin-antitoxin system HicB family antitoxin [Sphingomonas sp. CFBP 13720]MBD8677915.1 type II toxin-antitoxin system HicB family antitoxin [Sphingomonas sp. CFBP 13720]
MLYYPVELTPDDNDTVMVTFPDVPEAVSFGDDEAEALANAVDALETALNGYIADRREIPAPSAIGRRHGVSPSLLASLKLGIYATMRERGWRKADLARAMAVNPRQADRLLDLTHASTVAQLEQAAAVAGGRYVVEVRSVADFADDGALADA